MSEPTAQYRYSIGNLLASPNTYFFSDSGGEGFLLAYLASRAEALRQFAANVDALSGCDRPEAIWPLDEWSAWNTNKRSSAPPDSVLTLLKRFAVSKRLWTAYDENVRPTKYARFDNLAIYLRVGYLALESFSNSADARFLNIALQINDVVIAHADMVDRRLKATAIAVIAWEITSVVSLCNDGVQ